MTELLISVGGGLISGVMCLIALRVDIGWIKKAVEKLDERLYNLEVRIMK